MARERTAPVVMLALRELPTPRGGRIAALDYAPRRARGVTIVAGHGYSSSKANLDPLCAFLASHGFRVLAIDFPGHKLGRSGGRLDDAEDLVDAVAAAVRFARDAGESVVYVLGHSMGAIAALLACAADATLAGAVAIATGAGRPSALAALEARGAVDLRSAYVDGLTLQALVARTEPLLAAALPQLAGRPALYVAADRDGMVSLASVAALFAAAPEPKTFATIASDHTHAGEHARAVVLAWLDARHPRAARQQSAVADPN